MKVELNHDLGTEKGITCAEKILAGLAEEHKGEFSDLKQEISGNTVKFSLKAKGMNLSGKISVFEDTVVIESKLPFAARMFQGMIEEMIKDNADRMMKKCRE